MMQGSRGPYQIYVENQSLQPLIIAVILQRAEMTCRLCKNTAELRHSHVIPEFCFKPVYDDKHRAVRFTVNAGKHGYIQKGFREYLFCEDCEGRFNRLETYFANEWFERGKLPSHVTDDLVQIDGLDYAKFKLFHHSVLFRASVSTLPQFRYVSLGNNEEIFRRMLLADDPGEEHDFPFIVLVLYHFGDNRVASDIILQPEASKPNNSFVYSFTFAGCHWMYYASKCNSQDLMQHVFSKCGTLYLCPQSIHDNHRIAEFARNFRMRNQEAR